MQKGVINVKTENIFPIIKKFLYSDHEIFLRELVSNAVDATTKLKLLASSGQFTGEMGDITIQVILDAKAKTLTIRDRGIGMSAEEVDKYINQIAFSSAEEFIKKFKSKSQAEAANIIGHFGLGFYSSFMVSSQVEIHSKTYKKGPGSKAVSWTCDGSPDYIMDESDKSDRGTDIILHIADDSAEFLEEFRILDLLKKYSRFLPVPIQFGTETHSEKVEGEKDAEGHDVYKDIEEARIINNTAPLWKRPPVELKEEDYSEFYHELYPSSFDEPLFNIHLNVDYPFNLTGILYFPRLKSNLEVQRNKIQLYSNQVFITDSVENIVPDFLTLLHGVIDSPDIPLNVSRSYLQSDANVKKISSHISKKVADKLEELFKNKREDFEKKWDDIRVFIEYGMISDEKFYERAVKFALLKNTEGQYFTFDEYQEHVKASQTDKHDKVIYLYTTQLQEQHTFISRARERGYDVLVMDGVIDNHFVNMLEYKLEKCSFKRVDADVIDKLIEKEDALPSKLSEEEKEVLKPVFEGILDKATYTVVMENLSETDLPVIIIQPEFMRRMKDMSALGGGSPFGGNMPDHYNLIVNTNHPLVGKILGTEDVDSRQNLARQLTDLARLAQNQLKGEELTAFIQRSVEMIGK